MYNTSNNQQTGGRMVDISILRILATLALIFHHTCSALTVNPDDYGLSAFQKAVLDSGASLMTWAVPVFIMLTGALLLKPEKIITYRDCIWKYSRRILLALFLFGTVFAMIEIFFNERTITPGMIPQALLRVLCGKSWAHLWYLYMIIGVYLILPIVKAFADRAKKSDLTIALAILFVMNFVLPLIDRLFGITIAFDVPIVSFSVFYLLLGTFLYRYDLPGNRPVYIFGLVISLLAVLSIRTFPNGAGWIGNGSPVNVFMAAFMFLACKNIKIAGSKTAVIWHLDRLCFGVYLIHPVFINFAYKAVNITPVNTGASYLIFVFVFWLLFSFCSFAAAWVMYMIKPLRKYVL